MKRLGVILLVAVQVCVGLHVRQGAEQIDAPMELAIPHTKEDPTVDQMLEVKNTPDSMAMKASGTPEDDMQGEDGQVMSFHSEDALDMGGSGEAMQLSGPALPTVQAEDRKFDIEEEDPRVSEDMAEGSAALEGVIDARQAKLADYRQLIEDSKNNLESQSRDAKRLIQDAYSKQQYLHDLQAQVLEQSVALETQKQALAQKAAELEQLKTRLEQEAQARQAQNNLQTGQETVADAIQAQMEELQKKEKEFEVATAEKESKLKEMETSVAELKSAVEEKDNLVAKKESDMKQMYADLSRMSKEAEAHEAHLKEQEAAMHHQQEEMAAKESELEQKLQQLSLKMTHAKQDEMVGAETALQLEKPLSELSPEAREQLGVHPGVSVEDQIQAQPPIPIKREAVLVLPNPNPPVVVPEVVDRSSRDVETRLDERPPTYGQKLLVGQAYAAKFAPASNGDQRDPDGKCRNSRGEEVHCDQYALGLSNPLPPIIPSIGDLLDGDYLSDSGPCVLKCGYHKGVGRSLQYVSMEIPTKTVHNQTIACPKANNGYPFVSCMLMTDDSEQCRTTCVFDGSANPLKPQMLGVGGSSLNAEDFRSLAHTTYQTVTQTGCASRMAADPLVACEIKL